MTQRTEPMPDPVPEWLKEAVLREQAMGWTQWTDSICNITIARLLWERGEPEPVDPDVAAVLRILGAWDNEDYGNGSYDVNDFPSQTRKLFARALAAYKAEKART